MIDKNLCIYDTKHDTNIHELSRDNWSRSQTGIEEDLMVKDGGYYHPRDAKGERSIDST